MFVVAEGGADVIVLSTDPDQLEVTGPDGAALSFDESGRAPLLMEEAGEISVELVDDGRPTYVTFRFEPTEDTTRLRVEQRVDGEVRPFFTDFVSRPWIQPGTGMELQVEGEDAQTRVITSGVDGAEIVFLGEVPTESSIQRENDWLIRGPVHLRIDHHGERKHQLSLGVWASEGWTMKKIPGVPDRSAQQ